MESAASSNRSNIAGTTDDNTRDALGVSSVLHGVDSAGSAVTSAGGASAQSADQDLDETVPPMWKPRKLEDFYKREKHIGEGTYGNVFQYSSPDGTRAAMKQIKMQRESEGFPITAIREIRTLKALRHDNIIGLRDVISSQKGPVYMVFDFMDHDLTGLVDSDGQVWLCFLPSPTAATDCFPNAGQTVARTNQVLYVEAIRGACLHAQQKDFAS